MENQPSASRPPIEQPLRAELFSADQLVRHARALASTHRTIATRGTTRLLARLNQNEEILREYNRTTQATNQVRRVTHAAEWLLDNFYLIEEQIQMARRHLPRGYSRELPRLLDGTSAHLPRVYDIVLELIAHMDAQIEVESLQSFISAYQSVKPLKLGELWAVPIMLRLALIENLRRVTTRLTLDRRDRNLADSWVRRLEEMAGESPTQVVVVVAEMAQAGVPVSSSFVAQFYKSLSRQNAAAQLARNWMEQLLAQHGLAVEQLVQQDGQTQAADQVTISHSISSLRALSGIDWANFVEAVSAVEQSLRDDPAGIYTRMDFASRDRYRHCIEMVAWNSPLSESEVANKALELARAGAREKGIADRAAHVGYYLVDQGLPQLEASAEMRNQLRPAIERTIRQCPTLFYVGGMLALTAIGAFGLIRRLLLLDVSIRHVLWLAPVLILCSSQWGTAIMNWLSGLIVKPRLFARLDFSEGIPPEWRTMVVIPTLLTGEAESDHLLETLEMHYLSNRDSNLFFALLTDFPDAGVERQDGDEALLERVGSGIQALNRKYLHDRPNIFFLLHRPRRWNAGEKRWMGYERKRGKLADFNALLRGKRRESFSTMVGDDAVLPRVKLVITLDTDTRLPARAARQLAGIMAHPLNRPIVDPRRGIVTEGYGILQPRVGVSLPSAGQSWFARLFAGELGIDPYTQAVSDVYQDVFGEGSFIGKGIYDVDAFEQALSQRIPENSVLSHDLIESCFARSALVSDVELYEDHPSRYNTDAFRRHRWIRGDWQIARWLFPWVPHLAKGRTANPLSAVSRWKILDNLRRSIIPIALLVLMSVSWIWIPEAAIIGPLVVLSTILLPALLVVLGDALRDPEEFFALNKLRARLPSAGRQLGQIGLMLMFLPYESYLYVDAILRTLTRLLITRRGLLEWQTASESERRAFTGLVGFHTMMWIAPVFAIAVGGWLYLRQSDVLGLAAPFLALWLAAPYGAWRISQPAPESEPDLSDDQKIFLRRIARKTWRFFTTFVNAEENWLPPDNFQEEPAPKVASRTSPTNIGLSLLANLAACDFGYLPVGELIKRTQGAFDTMSRMERFRGHFFNWYDTRTLQVLRPLYVSSVDSGNLAGHLLTLESGFAEVKNQSIVSDQLSAGLRDTMAILQELIGHGSVLADLEREWMHGLVSLRATATLLQRTGRAADELKKSFEDEETASWCETLAQDCRSHLEDLLFLAPWLGLAPWIFPHAWTEKLAALDRTTLTLPELAELDLSLGPLLESGIVPKEWLDALRESSERAGQRIRALAELAGRSAEFAAMDFTFLYDSMRELFSIGYNVAEHRRDGTYYDLLASEARLCSFVAIAQGQVPQDHWFSLGRLLVSARGAPVLVSWSGSMFEYLMPLLVMPRFEQTLLEQTYRGAVQQQIEYGQLRRVPWGISESGYNLTDVQANYQYRAFGVPGLGLKRGLAEDLVIAPYASLLALLVAPREACENLQRLAAEGRVGPHGFYEAIDYTPSRLPPGQTSAVVRSYMVHHQGMGLLSLASLLLDGPMQRRFCAVPSFRSADLLLQERLPRAIDKVLTEDLELDKSRRLAAQRETPVDMRIYAAPGPSTPQVHLLSNGRYHLAVSSGGGGYSRWREFAVTRWREDATRDNWGAFIYVRDLATEGFWSVAFQPAARLDRTGEAIFTQARAEFRQHDSQISLHTEICVSPEDDVELRRVTLTNHTSTERIVELTSYAEVVLAPATADASHPAFSNLFVQTEFDAAQSAILCTRRARSAEERPPWLLHLLVAPGIDGEEVSCETDRAQFLGRGRTPANPIALKNFGPLSNTTGSVLDPVVSLRRRITLAPNSTGWIVFLTGMAETRESLLALAGKYRASRLIDRAFDLAWTHSQVALRQIDASENEAQIYGRLAGALIYADPARRAVASVLLGNRRGQNGLWSYGVSGDVPIVLLIISDPNRIEIVRQIVKAHSYWHLKGLVVELVILNEENAGYRQDLQDQIMQLIPLQFEGPVLDKPGGIFVRRLDQVTAEDRTLLQAVARISLSDENGTLAEQCERLGNPDLPIPSLTALRTTVRLPASEIRSRTLVFNNGLGGFTPDGKEYVITLAPGQMTPAPWVNVIANAGFGTVIAESGSAYTWAENSHEFRLTPWHNDPVSDPSGEAFYLRDELTGQFWSPTPLPARGNEAYVIRHGFGYSVFEHTENGIVSELWIYVAVDAPVKFMTLKIRNASGRARRLSATGYWEWVLGELRQNSLLHIHTEVDPKSGALLVRNPFNTEFMERIAFVDVNDPARTMTGDRREFLGRNGSLAQPASLRRARLSGRVGAGMDPCGAVQVAFDLAHGQEREVTFRLGVGRSAVDVQGLIQRFRRAEAGKDALEAVWKHWNRVLGAVHVETPDLALNLMANGWLLYQTLSCRFLARTGFYQSGGAIGFRDQLQDALALLHAEPSLTREHLLRAAARQFREGDVQHWWHPPSGRGVRTKFSDDFLWLPFAICRYVSCVADTGVLDEIVPFLEGRPLKAEEESYFDLPNRSVEAATLYDHGVRAIERGLRFGVHGLPLMGCGDWNDGMNRVGKEGKGESVWLAFFLCEVLTQFASLAGTRQDLAFMGRCNAQLIQLRQAIAQHGWDGAWYRRAYYDNGEPLGSESNGECQIDSLPQSWSVLAGIGDLDRSRSGLESAWKRLVDEEHSLVKLFAPPFDRAAFDPGYIKGYIPGVRENGGQYTHAAIWMAMALARLGEVEKSWAVAGMLNPISHGSTPDKVARYKVEPYVIAADIYAGSSLVGRGGWTWYTGSAGWMYRLYIETLLGLNLEGEKLRLTPRWPKAWTTCRIHYHFRQSVYHLNLTQLSDGSSERPALNLDGVPIEGNAVPLRAASGEHHVEMKFRAEGRGFLPSGEDRSLS